MYQLVANLFSKLVQRLGPLYYNERRDHRRSRETHRALFEAIAAGDAQGARALIERMLEYSESAITAEVERLSEAGLIGPGAPGVQARPA